MKIIKTNKDPWWVGSWIKCLTCGAEFILEPQDEVNAIKTDLISEHTIKFCCPCCSKPMSIIDVG